MNAPNAPRAEPPPKRIPVGAQVGAKRIFFPSPEYTSLAKMARFKGTVRLEAIIAKDATVQSLKVLSGHPLLAERIHVHGDCKQRIQSEWW